VCTIMKLLLLSMVLAAVSSTPVETMFFEKDEHSSLRHRQLKCTQKGSVCPQPGQDCCGKSECVDNKCCLPDGVKGCEDDADCCGLIQCDAESSVCGEGGAADGGRDCRIHGEECEVTGGDASQNTCCGSTKYLCEEVDESGKEKCCMAPGGKGCSKDEHCCGVLGGNKCDESRCVYEDGSYPGDAPGGRKCGLKGETCGNDSPCCGSKNLNCQNDKCCIVDGSNGCASDDHCCSGNCNTDLSLCVTV